MGERNPKPATMRRCATAFVFLAACAILTPCPGQNAAPPPATARSNPNTPTVDQIVALMVSHNESRAEALHGYTGRRVYHLEYRGFPGNRKAELIVETRFNAPATKEFKVISQSGSRLLIEKVLKGLLASEKEAQSPQNRQQAALTPQNYRFEFAGERTTDQGRVFILKVQPKFANKFLFRGEIWVDANDFAIARIDAEPAQNPSFWINHTKIEQQYAKFGSFWLPVRNQSTSKFRLGGTAILDVEYQDYRLSGDSQEQPAIAEMRKSF